jgi:serine/threonine protein kinase
MERTTFLEHYRICLNRDGAPHELSRTGAAITYKAVDERTSETVALKLIPTESVDPAAREQFEEEARAATRFNHINVVKVFDVGREEGHFVFASEYVRGEMLDSWVEEHGPMSADAVLRVALQIVSALSSASFHRLTLCAIQPSNLMVVPGSTPEGDWPFVKLTNFGLAGLKLESNGNEGGEGFSVRPQFASPEQLQNGTVDFRSEIYSLGATMYFLLTAAAPSAELRRRRLRVFPKPLRNLLAQMLRHNPDDRPKDPVALAEMIRECLIKIERRQFLARRLGIPLATVTRRESRTPLTPLAQVLRGILVFAAIVLAAGVLGAFLLPADMNPFRHRTATKEEIGLPIGVPETSPIASPQPVNAAPVVANQPVTGTAASPAANEAPSPGPEQDQTSNADLVAAATPANPPEAGPNAPATEPETSAEVTDSTSASRDTETASEPTTASRSASPSKKKRVASTSQRRTGSGRARMVGITSDGRLIYRLPSGRTRIVAPDSDEDEPVPRRRSRAFTPQERDEIYAPSQPLPPDYFPYD